MIRDGETRHRTEASAFADNSSRLHRIPTRRVGETSRRGKPAFVKLPPSQNSESGKSARRLAQSKAPESRSAFRREADAAIAIIRGGW